MMTNTPAVDAYRGAGRPEANYLMEQPMDHIAAETGHSRLDVRRVNMIKAVQMPYEMVSGGTIDLAIFLNCLKLDQTADVAGFPHRREQSDKQNKLRGIGYGMYLENVAEQMKGSISNFKMMAASSFMARSNATGRASYHVTQICQTVWDMMRI